MTVAIQSEQLAANQYAFAWYTQLPLWLGDAQPYAFMRFNGLAGTARALAVRAKDRGYGSRVIEIFKASGPGVPDLSFSTMLPNSTVNGTQTITPAAGSQNLTLVSTANFPASGIVVADGFLLYYTAKTATQLQNITVLNPTADIADMTVGDEFAEQLYLMGVGVYTLTLAGGTVVSSTYYSECGQICCAGVGFQSDFNPTALGVTAMADEDVFRQDFLTQHGGRDVECVLGFTIP